MPDWYPGVIEFTHQPTPKEIAYVDLQLEWS